MTVVSLLGGLTRAALFNPSEFAWRFADRLGAECFVLTREETTSLLGAGAVGDILCRFIGEDGEVLDHPLNDLVISADPKVLRAARRIVLASGGWEKHAAIRGSITFIKPHVLITDEAAADALLH